MAKKLSVEKVAAMGRVPAGYVELPTGEVVRISNRVFSLRVHPEDKTILAGANGAVYKKQADGSNKRVDKPKLTKAEKKFVKKLKKQTRDAVEDSHRRVIEIDREA